MGTATSGRKDNRNALGLVLLSALVVFALGILFAAGYFVWSQQRASPQRLADAVIECAGVRATLSRQIVTQGPVTIADVRAHLRVCRQQTALLAAKS